MDLNIIYLDKQGLNVAVIFFDKPRRVNSWEKVLILNNVRYVKYVQIRNKKTEYGFKMIGIRRKTITLCKYLKEVLNER